VQWYGAARSLAKCGTLLTAHLPIPVLIASTADLRADAYDRQDNVGGDGGTGFLLNRF